jgi:hypothetical protein
MKKQIVKKTVTIPAKPEHEGYYAATITVNWICPTCGQPRGEVYQTRSYDGSRILYCDGWTNPCGHVDKYADVLAEAKGEDPDQPTVYLNRESRLFPKGAKCQL